MSKAGTDTPDKLAAWDRLERLLGKARLSTATGEALSEQDAMKIAVQATKDVRRTK